MTTDTAELRALLSHGNTLGQSYSLFAHADDLAHIKAAARVILPDMKPQLRLEAIARALRFRTFASLTAALSEATPANPLLLQMAFGPRSDISNAGLEAHLARGGLAHQEGGLPLSLLGYAATGAAVLPVIVCARNGWLKELGMQSMLALGFDAEIGGHHRAAIVNGLPSHIVEQLHRDGAVLTLPSGFHIAPVARIMTELRRSEANQLSDRLDNQLDYDMSFVDYAGEGTNFGRISLDTATFVADNEARIDALPIGWSCSWPVSFGAVMSGWAEWSHAKKLAHIREHCATQTRDFPVPREQLGELFRRFPELAGEPEVEIPSSNDRHLIAQLMDRLSGRIIDHP